MSQGQKTPFNKSLGKFADARINDANQSLGQSLPCSVVSVNGAVVTVAFEIAQTSSFTIPNVTMPIQESRYVRIPVQVGDKGLAVPANTRLGGIDGLGSGLAPLSPTMNLGSLIFCPIGNKAWPTVDANAVVIQAPNGARILTDDGTSTIDVINGEILIQQGSASITISGGVINVIGNMNVIGNITATGTITGTGGLSTPASLVATGGATMGGIAFGSHYHSGVQTGSVNT